jgi:hypothetical protein
MSTVRWGVAGNIVTAWVLTLPGAGLIAALSYRILHAIVRVYGVSCPHSELSLLRRREASSDQAPRHIARALARAAS